VRQLADCNDRMLILKFRNGGGGIYPKPTFFYKVFLPPSLQFRMALSYMFTGAN
jgi:hypothetical protein